MHLHIIAIIILMNGLCEVTLYEFRNCVTWCVPSISTISMVNKCITMSNADWGD